MFYGSVKSISVIRWNNRYSVKGGYLPSSGNIIRGVVSHADCCGASGEMSETHGAAGAGIKVLPSGSAGQLLFSLRVWTVGPREHKKAGTCYRD